MSSNLDFFLLMEDYWKANNNFLARNPDIFCQPYEKVTQNLFSNFIYYGDSYKYALSREGYTAEQSIPACEDLQLKWAAENGMSQPPEWLSKKPFRWWWTQILRTKNLKDQFKDSIVTEQLKKTKPRVLWIFSWSLPLNADTIASWRRYADKIVLWWSCPIDPEVPYSSFDLILSSIPSLVKHFQTEGIDARYLPHSFDPRILQSISPVKERLKKVVFVGSLSSRYKNRVTLLDYLSRNIDLDFYGYYSINALPQDSPLITNYHGNVWGRDLYRIYNSYLLTVHKNIDIAENSFSAKRLFEATGMGTCVVAEDSDKIRAFFEPDKEIVTYRTPEDCLPKVRRLLANPQEAMEIGKRAQERTLRCHTYETNVKKLISYLKELKFI